MRRGHHQPRESTVAAADHDLPPAPPDGPSEVGDPGAAAHRRRRLPPRILASALTVVLAGTTAWWFGTPHPAMHLSGTGNLTSCAGRPTDAERDLVTGNVTFIAPRDAQLLSVTLLDPVNVTIADAVIAPTRSVPGGGGTIPGLVTGWPLTQADRAGYTIDWSGERDLADARLTAGVEEAPILHLRVVDPSQEASFRAWQVEYRMSGTRWVSTFTHAVSMPGAVGPCTE